MQREFRFLTGALALLMLLCALASCSGKTPQKNPETTERKTQETTEDDPYVSPGINYGGDRFRIYTWNATDEWVLDDEASTTPIDAQTYAHYCRVEDELGIMFEIGQSVSGGYGRHLEFINNVGMLSQAEDIDLVCQYSLAAIYGAMRGYYKNLIDQEYLNWGADYWSNGFVSSNTFNDKLYYCSGAVSRTTIYEMFLMTFNYELAQSYGIGDLYGMVDDGTWTIEKLKTLSQDIYTDVNNNNMRDSGDLFGLVSAQDNMLDPYQYGANLPCLTVNDFGELEINSRLTGDFGVSLCDRLRDLFHNNEGAYCASKELPDYYAMAQGRALFEVETAGYIIRTLNPSEINYGILPMPKYDSEQTGGYHTCLSMVYSSFSIPEIANDAAESAAVLEALAHDSYTQLIPYIYENNLKSRYSKRPQDARMFDLLTEGIVYDPGRVMDNVDIFSLFRRAIRDNVTLGDYFEASKSVIENGLNDINFAFSE